MVDARQEVIDELETFEKDYKESFDDENFDNETVQAADLGTVSDEAPEPEEGDPVAEETAPVAEVSQESDSGKPDQSGEEPKPQMVTLPDDKDAFGKFAGQKISYKQLAEEGLVDNLVTWGHQGRYMVGKGQEDLDEARKMREVLEKQVKIQEEDRAAAAAPAPLTPAQHSAQLVERYLPEMQRFAEAGGVETGFLDNYPKAAAYIEDRFQAASTLGNILVGVIDEIKKSVDPMRERDTTEEGRSRLRTLTTEVAESNDLFKFAGDDDGYKDFIKWATSENSTLHWVDKELGAVTAADIQSSMLLYMHENPEKFTKPKKRATNEERHLATGGTGQTRPSSGKQTEDEMTTFQKEYNESFVNQEF